MALDTGVVREKLVSPGEALVRHHLQRGVTVGSIITEILKWLRPSEFLEERFSLVRIEASESNDGGLVAIIVR
jgi:hypothetical protein